MATQGPSPPPSRHASPNSAHARPFVGRHRERSTLKQLLQSPRQSSAGQRRLVITGKAGQGKTALCTAVVDELRNGFSDVFRIDVSMPQAAQKDFANLLRTSGSTATDVSAALQYLANRKDDWLLVLENANDAHFTYEYFPPCDHGFIIITSREQSIARYETTGTLLLNPMSTDDSVSLLQQTIDWPLPQGSRESDCAKHAAYLLENHPLSLILAGTYVANRRCSFASYVSDLEMQMSEMQSNQANPESPWTSAYAACELSAKALTSSVDGSAALDLLSKLSLLPCSPVSTETAKSTWRRQVPSPNGSNQLRPPRREPNAVTLPPPNATSFEAALNRLLSLSFISIAPSDRITIHPIIRAWAQDRQHRPSPPRSADNSRSTSPCPHCSPHAPTTNVNLYPYEAHFEQTRHYLPQPPRADTAAATTTTTQLQLHFTTAPPSLRSSREPSPSFRETKTSRAYGPINTGDQTYYATTPDAEEGQGWGSSYHVRRRYVYPTNVPEEEGLWDQDDQSAGEEEEYGSNRHLRVVRAAPSRSRSLSVSWEKRSGEFGEAAVAREHSGRRRRRRRHGSGGSRSSDGRSEEERGSAHRGREIKETKLEFRGSLLGVACQAVFAATSSFGGRIAR